MVKKLSSADKKKWSQLESMRDVGIDAIVSEFERGGRVELTDDVRKIAETIFNHAMSASQEAASKQLQKHMESSTAAKKMTAKKQRTLLEQFAKQHFEEALPDIMQAVKERTNNLGTLQTTDEQRQNGMQYFYRSLNNFFHKSSKFGTPRRDFGQQMGLGNQEARGVYEPEVVVGQPGAGGKINYGKKLYDFFTKKGTGGSSDMVAARKSSPLGWLFRRPKEQGGAPLNTPASTAAKTPAKRGKVVDLDKFNSLGEDATPAQPSGVGDADRDRRQRNRTSIWSRAMRALLWPVFRTMDGVRMLGRGVKGGWSRFGGSILSFLGKGLVAAALAPDALSDAIDFIKEHSPTADEVKEFLGEVWGQLKEWGGEGLEWAWDKLKSMLGGAWTALSDWFVDKSNPVTQAYQATEPQTSGLLMSGPEGSIIDDPTNPNSATAQELKRRKEGFRESPVASSSLSTLYPEGQAPSVVSKLSTKPTFPNLAYDYLGTGVNKMPKSSPEKYDTKNPFTVTGIEDRGPMYPYVGTPNRPMNAAKPVPAETASDRIASSASRNLPAPPPPKMTTGSSVGLNNQPIAPGGSSLFLLNSRSVGN